MLGTRAALLLALFATAHADYGDTCTRDEKGSLTPIDGLVYELTVRVRPGYNNVDLTDYKYGCNPKHSRPGIPEHIGTYVEVCTQNLFSHPVVKLQDLSHVTVIVPLASDVRHLRAVIYCKLQGPGY